jgi:hypothetical protein
MNSQINAMKQKVKELTDISIKQEKMNLINETKFDQFERELDLKMLEYEEK